MLVRELERARLEAVQGKLHPHFTFNTLNAIVGLAERGDRGGVVRTLEALGELLQATLDDRAVAVVTLREELELLSSYVAIQQVRLGDRVTFERDVAPDTLEHPVPGMLLQPLVENALRHGVGRSRHGGAVCVRAARVRDGVEIGDYDSGPGLSDAPASAPGRGIGLDGTRARIVSLFGEEAHLVLQTTDDGGTEVRVFIPTRPR